jgi:hypothetical protein
MSFDKRIGGSGGSSREASSLLQSRAGDFAGDLLADVVSRRISSLGCLSGAKVSGDSVYFLGL